MSKLNIASYTGCINLCEVHAACFTTFKRYFCFTIIWSLIQLIPSTCVATRRLVTVHLLTIVLAMSICHRTVISMSYQCNEEQRKYLIKSVLLQRCLFHIANQALQLGTKWSNKFPVSPPASRQICIWTGIHFIIGSF